MAGGSINELRRFTDIPAIKRRLLIFTSFIGSRLSRVIFLVKRKRQGHRGIKRVYCRNSDIIILAVFIFDQADPPFGIIDFAVGPFPCFTREGVLRSSMVIKGRRRDMVVFSLLRSDPAALDL